MNQKITYLLRSLMNQGQTKKCPNCGGLSMQRIDSKYAVTQLLKCDACRLNFRYPVDSQVFQEAFYQSEYDARYSECTTDITDLPTDEQLPDLMKNNFKGKRDHSPFIKALLKSTSGKVIDYGCSWGYSVYQLKNAGYDAEGFEISRPRASFGKKIGVTIHSDPRNLREGNDLIMSNHAIEHLPVIADFIALAAARLTEDGLFVAFCPNGSPEYRRREPDIFHVNWGFLHPNYLDIEFAAASFAHHPYLILTGDWNYDLRALEAWDGKSQSIGNYREGKELLIIAKPNRIFKQL